MHVYRFTDYFHCLGGTNQFKGKDFVIRLTRLKSQPYHLLAVLWVNCLNKFPHLLSESNNRPPVHIIQVDREN